MMFLFSFNYENNNTNICNAHGVSKHTESEAQAVVVCESYVDVTEWNESPVLTYVQMFTI